MKRLFAASSFLVLAGCGPLVDIPDVFAELTGPASLEAGAQVQYHATILNVGGSGPTAPSTGWTIRWKTSDPAVLTVSATGMVTAVASGLVTITATPYRGKDTGFPDTLSVGVR